MWELHPEKEIVSQFVHRAIHGFDSDGMVLDDRLILCRREVPCRVGFEGRALAIQEGRGVGWHLGPSWAISLRVHNRKKAVC